MNINNLKHAREVQNMTQSQVASLLGITSAAYQNYEYGKREPNISKLLQLAVTFNVSLDDLLCLDDFKKSLEEPSDEH